MIGGIKMIIAVERKEDRSMNDDSWEEPEINPCRGCDDYDWHGGCVKE